jgi:hypothetical protein
MSSFTIQMETRFTMKIPEPPSRFSSFADWPEADPFESF